MIAMHIAGLMENKNVFVNERHNFTLVDVADAPLQEGGFEINDTDLRAARFAMDT
ncbi:hypothetical protein RCJ96_09755 [Bacillus sp. BSL6]|uniref:hypothetical protein n=1 Tax=Bacillus TaxID=1386 RepID=UPI001587FE05|nr:hypothetical protein [Bacillus cereus]